MRHTDLHFAACGLVQARPWSILLLHGAAESGVLVGGEQLVHFDSDGGQLAAQLCQGLLGQGGLPAHDPGELHVQDAKVGAAVDQGVVVVVGGQHPVRSWRRV